MNSSFSFKYTALHGGTNERKEGKLDVVAYMTCKCILVLQHSTVFIIVVIGISNGNGSSTEPPTHS